MPRPTVPETTLAELVADTDIAGAPEDAAERSELAATVWAVAAGLDRRQYTVLDLSVRQELDATEMAEVLGVTRNNAYVMINRTKAAFSESASDYLLYQDGMRNCELLREELATARIEVFSPGARKVIERHLKRCPRCAEKKKRLPMPLAMFGGLALAAPPDGLRERIRIALLESPGVPPAAGGTGAASGGGADKPIRRVALFAAGAVGALVVSLLVGLATMRVLDDDNGASLPVEPARTESPGPTSTSIGAGVVATTSTSAPSPSMAPPSTETPSPTPSPAAEPTAPSVNEPPVTQTPTTLPTSSPPPTSPAVESATATPTTSPTSTPTSTATPSPTLTNTPTSTPAPTSTPTPSPLQFSSTSACWVSPNGNLKVTVVVSNANSEPLSGSATFGNTAANFAFNGNTGVAVIPILGTSTGQASTTVFTPTRRAAAPIQVGPGLCS